MNLTNSLTESFRPTLVRRLLLACGICFALMGLAISGPSHARTASEVLSQVLQESLREHPAVKARRAEFSAAEFDLAGAEWGRFPSLAFQAQVDEASNNGRSVTLTQPLWTGGRLTGQIDLASANKERAAAVTQLTEQEVIQQTAAAFFEVLRLESRLEAAKENYAEHQKLLELINRRVELEVSPETDRVLAQARADQAKSEEIQAMRAVASMRQVLSQLLGRPLNNLQVPPSLKIADYPTVDSAMSRALEFSPALKQVEFQIEAATATASLARAQSFPTLVAGYEHIWRSGSAEFTGGSDSTGRSFVGIQYQPGAGLASVSVSRAAESRRLAALESEESVRRQLSASVNTAMSELASLKSQFEPAQRQFQRIESVLESYLRQYQIGRKTWIDVLNVQREKIATRSALSDVTFGIEVAKVRLAVLVGDLTPSTVLRIHD